MDRTGYAVKMAGPHKVMSRVELDKEQVEYDEEYRHIFYYSKILPKLEDIAEYCSEIGIKFEATVRCKIRKRQFVRQVKN